MDKIKIYKPGQLITINNKVYRIKALIEEDPQKDKAIKDKIELIKKIKNLIQQNNLWYSYWDDGGVNDYVKNDGSYVRSFNKEKNFEFLNELFDLYLLKYSNETITFTEEELEKIKTLKEAINNDRIWRSYWGNGGVYNYLKGSNDYVRAFEDKDFSLLKKMINLCIKRSTKLDS